MMRQMVMVGFLPAQNCTNLVSSWRHPESRSDSPSADYYRTVGGVLEEGNFHVGSFDDRLAMPDRHANDHRHILEHGKEVADELEEWLSTGVGDGFMIAATHVQGTYIEFVRHVVPEQQRLGLYHKDYTRATPGEDLGLPTRHGRLI